MEKNKKIKGIKIQFNLMGLDSLSFEKEFDDLETAKEFYLNARELFTEEVIGKTQDRYRNNSFKKSFNSNSSETNKKQYDGTPTPGQKAFLMKHGLKIPATYQEASDAVGKYIRENPRKQR